MRSLKPRISWAARLLSREWRQRGGKTRAKALASRRLTCRTRMGAQHTVSATPPVPTFVTGESRYPATDRLELMNHRREQEMPGECEPSRAVAALVSTAESSRDGSISERRLCLLMLLHWVWWNPETTRATCLEEPVP